VYGSYQGPELPDYPDQDQLGRPAAAWPIPYPAAGACCMLPAFQWGLAGEDDGQTTQQQQS
jgi:hypothetical protein